MILTEAVEATRASIAAAVGDRAVVLTDQTGISQTLQDGRAVVMVPWPSVTWTGWELRDYSFDLWAISPETWDPDAAAAALSDLVDALEPLGLETATPATYQDGPTPYPMIRITYHI